MTKFGARNRELTIFYLILKIGDRCSELDLQNELTHLYSTFSGL